MLKQQDYIINTEEEFEQINSVKEWVQSIHENGTFFHLSLKTLELIRRFNNFYIEIFERNCNSPSILNQLVITSKCLEKELIREN